MTNSSSSVVFGLGSFLLVAGLGMAVSASFQHQPSSSITDIDEEDDIDYITEEDVCKIFDKLFLEMQAVYSQLMQQLHQLEMAGQRIPQKHLQNLIRTEMERALTAKQGVILEQFDVDYDCLEEATWEFLENEDEYPKVKKAVERVQKLWENTTGDQVVGWRPGKEPTARSVEETLSAEKTIEMAEVYFNAITETMRTLVAKYKAEGKNLQDQVVAQALNAEFTASATQSGETALEVRGVTQNQFEASVRAHSNDVAVTRALGQLQMKQQQEMMAIG